MTTPYLSQIEWPEPFWNFLEFAGIFLALGAIGFRYTSLRGRLGGRAIYGRIARIAAALGTLGAILTLWHIIQVLPRIAERAKLPVGQFLTTATPQTFWFYLTALAIAGFALAAAGKNAGWHIAAIGIIAGLLRNIYQLEFGRMTTPMHVLTGGLWIGTLFMLVVAGLNVLLREKNEEGRGALVADMVNRFSPLALTCGISFLAFGVIAVTREVKPLSGLWTTAYGYTLIAKVCTVAVVLSLGAWNWKRQRPSLGSDNAALSLKRSATNELIAATVVLILTSIMLSLPEPH
jgi:putative copper export protein